MKKKKVLAVSGAQLVSLSLVMSPVANAEDSNKEEESVHYGIDVAGDGEKGNENKRHDDDDDSLEKAVDESKEALKKEYKEKEETLKQNYEQQLSELEALKDELSKEEYEERKQQLEVELKQLSSEDASSPGMISEVAIMTSGVASSTAMDSLTRCGFVGKRSSRNSRAIRSYRPFASPRIT